LEKSGYHTSLKYWAGEHNKSGKGTKGLLNDKTISSATEEELERFLKRQESWDLNTGLNPFVPEYLRLWRAREAMLSAIAIFNNPQQFFKAESFCVNACIAWTYLLHHAYTLAKGSEPINSNGKYLSLSDMITKPYAGLHYEQQANLKSVIEIRDDAVHRYLDPNDERIFDALFLSCAINFDFALRTIGGEKKTIADKLTFALHLSAPKLNNTNISLSANLPNHVSQKIDSIVNPTDPKLQSSDYQSVIRAQLVEGNAQDSSTRIINTGQANGVAVLHPTPMNKPRLIATEVVQKVAKRHPGFKMTSHTIAWKYFKVREANPSLSTDEKYCWAEVRGKSVNYSYSDAWVEKLIDELNKYPNAINDWKAKMTS